MAGHPGMRQERSVKSRTKTLTLTSSKSKYKIYKRMATPPMSTGMKLGYRERRTIAAHARNRSSSPFTHPTPNLDLCAQPGRLLFTRERERNIYPTTHTRRRHHRTHTQCHKPKPGVDVKVKWSRKTNRCASGGRSTGPTSSESGITVASLND